ncbi:ParA family protein [Myxococcota bacterium]|nr:ParA family protein [Myxococcota bacterium]MBU1428932.1 ParA family protein [Myxococcota bacterium]MBU1900035.1 ParA family protein [Myxococcota bacterium]
MRIVVAARKGGVGKSSIVAGLASALSSQGRRVLVMDLDPQSNLAFMLGGDPTGPGVSDLLSGQTVEPETVAEGIDVLPGGPELASHEIARLDPEDLADTISGWPYDDVLFDCPPGNEHLERLGVVAADIALVVTNAHPIAVVGAGRVLEDLQIRAKRGRRGPTRWALVMNMIDARRRLDRNIEVMIEDYPDVPRLKVRQDTQMTLATAQGIPLFEFAPRSKAAEDIMALMEWARG